MYANIGKRVAVLQESGAHTMVGNCSRCNGKYTSYHWALLQTFSEFAHVGFYTSLKANSGADNQPSTRNASDGDRSEHTNQLPFTSPGPPPHRISSSCDAISSKLCPSADSVAIPSFEVPIHPRQPATSTPIRSSFDPNHVHLYRQKPRILPRLPLL